jgi:hypothetical protein
MSKEPSAVEKMIGDFAPKLVDLTDRVLFGDVWERPELSKRDRSLATVAALIALHRPDQLRFHLGRTLENGLKKEDIDRGNHSSGVLFGLAQRDERHHGCKRGILEGVSTNGKTASLRRPNKIEQPRETDTTKLARLISAYAPHDGVFELRTPGVHASRLSRFNRECVHTLRLPCLSIFAQGAKTIIVGQQVYEYDPSRMLVYSVALPVAAQVTQASYSEPYLALRLDLEPQKIAELVLKVYPHGVPPVQERSAVYITPVDLSIVNAAIRLMECLAQPGDAELLAPLVVDEILIRLLRSPIGVRVAQMGFAESSVHRVAKAISWLRTNFSQPMKVCSEQEFVKTQ